MFTANQLRTLAASAEFQRLLAEDPHLRELEDSQYDRRDEYLGLRNALRFSFSLGPLELHPPTPALWAYLWATGNAYASDFEHADDLDTDIAVFLLSRKWEELQRPPAEIAATTPTRLPMPTRQAVETISACTPEIPSRSSSSIFLLFSKVTFSISGKSRKGRNLVRIVK